MPAPVTTEIQNPNGPETVPGRWFASGKVLLVIPYQAGDGVDPWNRVPGGRLSDTVRAIKMVLEYQP